ncbi:MAG: cob(I)yrinic acid a,c-diamide adenosyltransferase [bacterium]|nr:cob(I)yrinic acid a,c-diamide adenosyltransferase [bacterium]
MKIYTKKGDGGRTHLATGARVEKNHPRVDLYGNVDELNSYIGVAMAQMQSPAFAPLRTELEEQQKLLFEMGSELAGFRSKDPDGEARDTLFQMNDIEILESAMDRMSEDLEPMRSFILPGGSPASAALQVCRTIARRLERMMVDVRTGPLANQDENGVIVHDLALGYTNRLSDYLFVAARYSNKLDGVEDIKWTSRSK